MGRTRLALAGAMALMMGLPSNAAAQTYQRGLRGAVRDADRVPGAAVVLTNVETRFDRTTVSNDNGEYAFPNLVITHNGTHKP
jgi:hypothetical protein